MRELIQSRLPEGYAEQMDFGMICYVIPLETYPETYNGHPLMYAALASQKRHMAVYLMNIYGDEGTLRWFTEGYAASGKKLDMGKSCVRFKKLDDLPLELIGTLSPAPQSPITSPATRRRGPRWPATASQGDQRANSAAFTQSPEIKRRPPPLRDALPGHTEAYSPQTRAAGLP